MKYYTYSNGLRRKELFFIRVEKNGVATSFRLDGYSELGTLIKPYKKLKIELYRVPQKLYSLSKEEMVNKFLENKSEFGKLI